MTRILVTGASGFVGRAVIHRLRNEPDVALRASYRHCPDSSHEEAEPVQVGDLGPETDWRSAVTDIDVIIHCAARVHVMDDTEADPLAAFRHANVEGTLQLARSAVAAGCRRLVFLSSIKVNGESTVPGQAYTEAMAPRPMDPYGVSKLEAEQALFALARETGLEVVVIRPPLVYGLGVRANFLAMIRAVARGIPLPLGAIHNLRSLVGVENLADLIACCARHPLAAGEVFLVSDGEDVSTSDLLRRLGRALGKPARLLPVPPALIRVGATLLGRRAVAARLCGSLQVDSGKARRLLGWTAPLSLDEGLRGAAATLTAAPPRANGKSHEQ